MGGVPPSHNTVILLSAVSFLLIMILICVFPPEIAGGLFHYKKDNAQYSLKPEDYAAKPLFVALHFRRGRLPRPQRLPQRRGASTPAKDTAPVPSDDEVGAGLISPERSDGDQASSPILPLETLPSAGRA